MKIKLGVIFGGDSVEHEVSIISALQAIENVDEDKYEVVPIYIGKDRTWYTGNILKKIDTFKEFEMNKKFLTKVVLLRKDGEFVLLKTNGIFRSEVTKIDVAFPVVHGKGVEDGSLAGYLDSIGIPFVGPGIVGASLGQDKVLLKQMLIANGINTPSYTWFYDYEFLNDTDKVLDDCERLGYPVIVKPANLGSTIGITVAHNRKELDSAINEACKYEKKILVEVMVENLVEVNCAILGNHEKQRPSLIAKMLTDNELLTFDDKYLSGTGSKKNGSKVSGGGKMSNSSFEIPAKLDKEVEEKVFKMALDTFRVLNLKGVCRIDFLINEKTKEVYVNEPNTIPGSLSFYMFKPDGLEYRELINELVRIAIKEYNDNKKKVSSFDSSILNGYNGSKGVKK